MENLLKEKGSISVYLEKNGTMQSDYVFSKGLKFNFEVSCDSVSSIATILFNELFPIELDFSISVDIEFEKNHRNLGLISSTKHVLKMSVDYTTDNIVLPHEIIFKNVKNFALLRCIFTIKCEEDLYENWDLTQLNTLAKELKYDIDKEPISCYDKIVWDTRLGADFVFIVDKKEFKVHKCILAVQSKVFERMFYGENNMQEAVTNTATITDITAESFEIFLAYLYVRSIPEFSCEIINVFKVADKYEIGKLMLICEKTILKHLVYGEQGNKEEDEGAENEEENECSENEEESDECESELGEHQIDQNDYQIDVANLSSILQFANVYDKELIKLITFEKIKEVFPNHTLSPNLKNNPDLVEKLIQAKNKMISDLKRVERSYECSLSEIGRKRLIDIADIENTYVKTFGTIVGQATKK